MGCSSFCCGFYSSSGLGGFYYFRIYYCYCRYCNSSWYDIDLGCRHTRRWEWFGYPVSVNFPRAGTTKTEVEFRKIEDACDE